MKRIALFLALAALPALAHAQAAPTNCSGTITTGGTAQVASAANVNRRMILVQNPLDATEKLVVDFPASAAIAAGSIERRLHSRRDCPAIQRYIALRRDSHGRRLSRQPIGR